MSGAPRRMAFTGREEGWEGKIVLFNVPVSHGLDAVTWEHADRERERTWHYDQEGATVAEAGPSALARGIFS